MFRTLVATINEFGTPKSLDRSPSDFPVSVSVSRSLAVVTAYQWILGPAHDPGWLRWSLWSPGDCNIDLT